MAPPDTSEEEDEGAEESPRGPPTRGPPSRGPPSRGPPGLSSPNGPPSGPPGGPPSGPTKGPPAGPPSGPPSRAPPSREFQAPEPEPEPEPVDEAPTKRGPPSRGPPDRRGAPARGPPRRRGPPVQDVSGSEDAESESFDAALARMTGQEEEVIIDAEKRAAQEAAESKEEVEEEAEVIVEDTDKWEEPEEEEEPLPEIEALPQEAAEGSRYPKLKKANTGRLKDSPLKGHVVPHTHWDRAWYLPFQKYRYRLVELVDDLLDLMENNPKAYPSFELDGQTVVLEDYLDVKPENEDRIRKLVEKGRLNIGPWYVLPDEFIVGGEALVRNLLMGERTARRWGGRSEVG